MEKLPLIEMGALKTLTNVESFQEELIIAELDGTLASQHNAKDLSAPVRMNALIVIITLQGSSDFCLDYIHNKTTKGQLTTIFPSHTVQLLEVSPDFKAKMLVFSKDFLDGWLEKRTPSMINYLKLVKNPFTQLDNEEMKNLLEGIHTLLRKIKDRTHFFQKEALQVGIISILIELANIFMGKKEGMVNQTFSRKEELLNQFLELLFMYCKEEHQVSFYADKLCISPQYLSLILKEVTGKSASKWIDEALMTEAKILLKSPSITVQQVANTLNFSDQSTFGKFFKKHQKISPLEYRKS
jgi:AraC-type DNA-binding domain-containing proteins